MTTGVTSLQGTNGSRFVSAAPSLADVEGLISEMPVLPQVRRNMASAIHTLCRVLGREARSTPIATRELRRLTTEASPGAAEVSPSRWRNIKSDVSRAIELSGLLLSEVEVKTAPLTAEWEEIVALAGTTQERWALRRLGRFCSTHMLQPAAVTDDVIKRYEQFLDSTVLSKTPLRHIKDLVRIWNRCVATDPSGCFSRLDPRDGSHSYTPGWADMPPGLAADAERFRVSSVEADPFRNDPLTTNTSRKPVSPATAKQRDRMIRRLAAAEMHAGVEPDQINSLAALLHPDRLERGLRFFIERNGGEPSKQAFEMASLAHSIAKHWARLPTDQVATIAGWASNLHTRPEGMTDRNRERLRQFIDRGVIKSFLQLPERLIKAAQRKPPTCRSAKLVQIAVAIAILTEAPLRIGNLRRLDRQKHFKRAISLENPTLQLVISRAEVKNRVDLRFPVTDRLRDFLDVYMKIYQPLLTNGHPSTLLFPGRTGLPLSEGAMRTSLVATILKEAGLHIHPHLFRHLCAYLYLLHHPGQYESVRQLLGHKSIQTTITFYASFLNDPAMEIYSGLLESHRSEDSPKKTEMPGRHPS